MGGIKFLLNIFEKWWCSMKFFSLVALTAFMAAQAHAEIVTCTFTEPFLTVKYDPSQKTVSVHEGIEDVTDTYKVTEAVADIDGLTTITWGSKDKASLLRFYTDVMGGSDGMSDLFFPMTGEMNIGETLSLTGGCETALNPSVDPHSSQVPGCYEILRSEFEDAASYYKAVSEKIIQPLLALPSAQALANFLRITLIDRGDQDVDLALCRTVDEALKP